LTETMNGLKAEFGGERLREIVKASTHDSAAELEREIIGAVGRFRGDAEQHDDLTLVVVKAVWN
jgi:phosphoserine phosphatase RsbU/P